ncbi:MAG: prepilin-type N-terminal cleavage/methylation domain-containing protein [Halanaerobiales bacterium]|nr:prepilin-type N-terminal cleavage/methylation domain-containing protein [Halanaerobiales bacterium]
MKKINDIIKNNNGFTLIEILLAIAIIGIAISMSTGMITQAFRIIIPNNERMNVKQMAEINLREISPYVRNAKDIDTTLNKIVTNNDYEVLKENNQIVIYDNNGNQIRTINNISNFEINENSNIYTVIIEKCIDSSCDNIVSIESEIIPRN